MQKRNIFTVMFFSLITFGIYMIFWLKFTRDEMVANGKKIPKLIWLLIPFVAFAGICLLQLLAHFVLVSGVDSNGVGGGNTIVNILSVIVGVAAVIAIIPLTIYWIYQYCKAVEEITNGQTPLGLSFSLWLVMAFIGFLFIWPGIIQDGFNKVTLSAPTDGNEPPLPPTPPALS